MKEKGKKTMHTIPEVDTPDFIFLGIVTSEPDYKLSVILNKRFGISLHHDSRGIIDGNGESASVFSVFNTSPSILSLVANKCERSFLLRKLKNIDYFLVIHGVSDRKKAESLASDIRSIQEVTAVFVFDSCDIKDKKIKLLAK